MNIDLSLLFQHVLSQSLKAGVLVASIVALRFFFGNRLSPAVKHGVWLLVPVALLVTIPSSWSVYNLLPELPRHGESALRTRAIVDGTEMESSPGGSLSPETGVAVSPAAVVRPDISEQKMESDTEKAFTAPSISRFTILACVWLPGCLGMTLIFLRQMILCRRWIAGASPLKDGRILSIFEECTRQFGLRCWILALKSEDVAGPFLVGAVRPRLLLPRRFVESATDEDLQNVFCHELAHLKRYDVWTGWLMSFLLILHWFNPFLWLAIRLMNEDREQACDVMALKKQDWSRRKSYSLLLVTLAEQGNAHRRMPGLVGLSETGRRLADRLETIRRIGSWSPFWTAVVCVPVLLLTLTSVTDAENHRGLFSLLFPGDRYSDRFDEFDGTHENTSGFIRELLGDAEELNHELRIVVRQVRKGETAPDRLEKTMLLNVKLRMLMDEIRSRELRMRRKTSALQRSEALLSLHEETLDALRPVEEHDSSIRPLIEETQRLTDRLTRVCGDLSRAEKLNGYTFELIEESEGIQFRLGILLDEIRGPSSRLDRRRSMAAEIDGLLTEYRLLFSIDGPFGGKPAQDARDKLVKRSVELKRIDSDDSRSLRLLKEAEESVAVLRKAVQEKQDAIAYRRTVLQLSELTFKELHQIFREHP